jgi:hypothetical protein
MATLGKGQQPITQMGSYDYLVFIKNPGKHGRRIEVGNTIALDCGSEKGVNRSMDVKVSESILTGPVSADLGMELDMSQSCVEIPTKAAVRRLPILRGRWFQVGITVKNRTRTTAHRA